MRLIELVRNYLHEQEVIVELSCITHRYSLDNKSDFTKEELAAFFLGATIVWNTYMIEPTDFKLWARYRLPKQNKEGREDSIAAYHSPSDYFLLGSLTIKEHPVFKRIPHIPAFVLLGAIEGMHKVQNAQGDYEKEPRDVDEYVASPNEVESMGTGMQVVKAVYPKIQTYVVQGVEGKKQNIYKTPKKSKFASILVDISREQVKRGFLEA